MSNTRNDKMQKEGFSNKMTMHVASVEPQDIYCGMLGLCIGDALGVPVEFTPRSVLDKNPIDDIVGYGAHNKPPGTWSDDTSMALALADSLAGGNIDHNGIMKNFASWLYDGEYTADGQVFDFGRTTVAAIEKYSAGKPPLECGGTASTDNGNGSLMRILPAVFFLVAKNGVIVEKDSIETIHCLSALTHAHNISKMACVFYCNIAFHLMINGRLFRDANEMWRTAENRRPLIHKSVESAIREVYDFYCDNEDYAEDIGVFERLMDRDFRHYKRDEIKSTGYVVDTLEAAVWCMPNNDDYAGTVLSAVNLGEDTDTVAAVAGGLAGLFYRDDREIGIPGRWATRIVNIDLVKTVCNRLSKTLCSDQSYFEYWGGK